MKFYFSTVLFLLLSIVLHAQLKTATLCGKVLDANAKPLANVMVKEPILDVGMETKKDGTFELILPANTFLNIQFFKPGYKIIEYQYRLNNNEKKNISITLATTTSSLGQVVKRASRNRGDAGNVKINVAQAGIMPSTIGGVEGLLKVFLSGNNNELTSQYNVRGGNFDENLVYINDFEVYRPFLVRSGQQEGLSIINSDLVNNINFSTGGFQAKYGDKMSSVLDVQYRKPKKFGGSTTASLLGVGAHVEGISRNSKLSYLIGVRQKSNQYLLGAQQTSGVYNPSFTDMQAMINYTFNDKWSMELLGNYARNRFNYIPEELNSSFGLINKAFNLNIRYIGSETDQFDSRFAGLSFTNTVNDKLTLKYLASGFQTNEYETYDLNGEYILGEIETDLGKDNFGQVKYALGTGIVHTFARNYLTMNVLNVGHRGTYDKGKHFYQWGVNVNATNINDQLNEWERRDSAGFSQPASTTELYMARRYKAENNFNYQVLSGFMQDNLAFDSAGISLTYGLRFNYNNLNKEFFASPRAQVSWKPKKWKRDAILRGAIGAYIQPPFYREMRNYDGVINTNVKAQKSAHLVIGTDYNFKKWDRPFKLTAETYYKYLWDLVPYEYDNVRIRYWGRNNAVGYAAGTEMRLYGDIVKGAESWVSMGVMKTGENILDDKSYKYASGVLVDSAYPGYIPRPTDSRFTFGLFFQDYFPTNKNIKVHINGMYGTGLPFGPPDNNRYGDTLRLPSYRRVDMGFSALLVDGEKKNKPYYSIFHKMNSIWLSVEVFNLLGILNTISYQWIQDRGTERTYAVPNRLTSRLLNVKLLVKW
jgi:hypothetical protein